MSFSITILEQKGKRASGEIRIGSFRESLNLPLGYWAKADYENQWKTGLERVVDGDDSFLVTSIYKPIGGDLIEVWRIYNQGDQILFQNQFLFPDDPAILIAGSDVSMEIPTYSRTSDEGTEISEWSTSRNSIREFLTSLKGQ
jgi:hypothetical protein